MPQKLHRILQTNINHSARAQDLLMQTMAEWGIGVSIVAEPYLVLRDRNGWAGDNNNTIAIIKGDSNVESYTIPFAVIGRGDGCVAVKWGELVIIGIYFSPNKSLALFERFLDQVESMV